MFREVMFIDDEKWSKGGLFITKRKEVIGIFKIKLREVK